MSNILVDERWSTKRYKDLMKMYRNKGIIPDKHPFFQRKVGRRKGNLNWSYTSNELLEFAKCEEDIVYFANNFVKILTKEGRKLIGEVEGVRGYQEEMLKMFQDNQFSIILASRQIGKSITVAIYVAWYCLFHSDANILLLSETGKKAKDLFKKIKEIQDAFPMYMQLGLEYDSTGRRIYDNGCSIESENTTENSGVSGSYEFVYWDEMAILDPSMQNKIFTGVFPTMASFGEKAKFIITSTPRGRNNKFYHIWNGATSEPDSADYMPFAFMKIFWHQVGGREAGSGWEEKERAIMGDEGFEREYNLSFDADGSLLVEESNRKKFAKAYTKYIIPEEEVPSMKKVLRIRPDYELEWFKDPDRKFHISIDIAGGKNRDYTVFNIFELKFKSFGEINSMNIINSELDFFKLEQVGMIRNNQIKTEFMAIYLYNWLTDYMIPLNVKLTIELNYEGKFFKKCLFEFKDKDKSNKLYEFQEEMVVSYPRNMDFESAHWDEGINQNSGSKQESCKTINSRISRNDVTLSHATTIDEGLSFGKNKKGSYEGLGKIGRAHV